MDATALATFTSQVMAMLTPFIPFVGKAGEAIATETGDAAFEKAQHLYEAIRNRFAHQSDEGNATKALDTFVKDPDNASTVEIKLYRILQSDPDFVEVLRRIIMTYSGPTQSIDVGTDSQVRNIEIKNKLNQGTQGIHGGDRTIFDGVIMDIGNERK